jgi:PAS domain S-box-containing protein
VEGLLSDLTERKRAEQEIENLQRYNRGLIESNLDPLVTFDSDGVITDVNVAMIHATGRTREELVGTPFADYFTDPKKAYKGAMLTFERGEVRNYELVMKAGDGTEIIVSYNAHLYRDPAGKVAGAFAAARDITARRAAEEELKKNAEELKGFNKLAVGRELKMIELKKEINALLEKLGEAPGYEIAGES